jgi:hypothetical protein
MPAPGTGRTGWRVPNQMPCAQPRVDRAVTPCTAGLKRFASPRRPFGRALGIRGIRGRRRLPVFAALLLASAPPGASAASQDCEVGRISGVFIDNHSVFDPASIPDDRRIRWAYRAANRIHMRTRPSFISDELLLRAGDCYDPELARESARILREFRFIAWADAYSVPQDDGTRHLVVETRDEWTTKIAGDLRFEGGLELRGLSLVEENFVGRGISIGAFYLEDDERRDVGGLFELPRAGRTNWDVALSASRTRVGNAFSQAVIHPFVGEVGTFAFRQRASVRHDLFTWVVPDGEPWSHLVVPIETGRLEMAGARRFGRPGRFLLLGAGVSREWVRPGAAAEVEGVTGGAFNERTPVPDSISSRLESQLLRREATRVSLLAGIRRIGYVERTGLDALAGVQDVPVGGELLVSVGPSVSGGAPVTPAGEVHRDLFTRADGFGGFASGSLVGQVHLAVEGRSVAGVGTRDVLAEGHAFLYHQLRSPHTIVLRASAQAAWRTDGPVQLTLGGPDGVRGFDEMAWPGARRFVTSVEARSVIWSPFPDLVDLGTTVFVDVGRMLPGDVPWGVDSEMQGTVGAGLRIGFPAGSSAVLRIDVAQPVGPGAASGPRLLIQAREWVGILGSFESLQLGRARRSGVRAQFTGVNRTPSSR